MTDFKDIIRGLHCCRAAHEANIECHKMNCPLFDKDEGECRYSYTDLRNLSIRIIDSLQEEIESRDKRESYLFRKIHERDSEIERLKNENESLRMAANSYKMHYEEMTEEKK